MAAHRHIQGPLARVSKRRMADVVNQRESLHQINIQIESCGDGAGDLRDLEGVGQAGAKVVRVAAGEDLRLVFQPAERPSMDDAITVALKGVTVGMRRLRIAPSARVLHAKRVAGEHEMSLAAVRKSKKQ